MGSKGDYRRREPKKPKKDVKKPDIAQVLPPSVEAEVVKKGKARRGTLEEKEKE